MPTYGPETTAADTPEAIVSHRSGARTTGSGLIPGFQAEIDGFYVQMTEFNEIDTRGTMATLAAMSARVSFMRSQVIRNEGRQAAAFRTRQIEPFLEEVDRQFKTWSRYQAIVQMEFDASKGGY